MLLVQLLSLLVSDPIQFIFVVLLLIVPLMLSVTFHEWAHGIVAYNLGDPTPKLSGRLTLNPFAHIDPVGTLMLLLVGIGWAKPVPVNTLNIPEKYKLMLVAIAGPLSNFLLAILFSILLVIVHIFAKDNPNSFFVMLEMPLNIIIKINLILAVFNLIPIPPLDGSRVIYWLLPDGLSQKYNFLEPYGIFIVFILLFTVGFKFIVNIAEYIQTKLILFIAHIVYNYLQLVSQI